MQGAPCSRWRTSSSLHFKYRSPAAASQAPPPGAGRGHSLRKKYLCWWLYGMYFFFCFPSCEGKQTHISTHRPVTHCPPVTLASPCSGAEASCGGRQLAGATEGSNKPSLTSSSWRVKPGLLDLPSAPHRGRSSVAHTHTRPGHNGACRSSVHLVLSPRRPFRFPGPSTSPSFLHLVLF